MGQIIIDLPLRVKRHYKIDDVESAKELLAELQTKLQTKARRGEDDDNEKLTAEDLADIRAAKRARKGDLISWEDAKAFLQTLE